MKRRQDSNKKKIKSQGPGSKTIRSSPTSPAVATGSRGRSPLRGLLPSEPDVAPVDKVSRAPSLFPSLSPRCLALCFPARENDTETLA